MGKFIVMCCRDGKFDEPKVFENQEQAYDFMKNEYDTVLGWNPDIEEMNHDISDTDAWVEAGDHQTYWGITELVEKNIVTISLVCSMCNSTEFYRIYEYHDGAYDCAKCNKLIDINEMNTLASDEVANLREESA